MDTTNKSEITVPNHDLVKESHTAQLIRKENLSDLLRKPRNISGPLTGFGSKLPRHDRNHDARRFETTNASFYGTAFKDSGRAIVKRHLNNSHIAAGREPVEKENIKRNVFLVAEILRKSDDPQHDTEAQRTWIGKEDAGIEAVRAGTVPKGVPKRDNGMSLPLGEGCRTLMPVKTEPGAYRRIRQDVTLRPLWDCNSRFKHEKI